MNKLIELQELKEALKVNDKNTILDFIQEYILLLEEKHITIEVNNKIIIEALKNSNIDLK